MTTGIDWDHEDATRAFVESEHPRDERGRWIREVAAAQEVTARLHHPQYVPSDAEHATLAKGVEAARKLGGPEADILNRARRKSAARRKPARDRAAREARLAELNAKLAEPQLTVNDYEGTVGRADHITRGEHGTMPTAAIARLPGVKGERPGEHRNYSGPQWEGFKRDIAAHGITNPIFITVDYGKPPMISEGNQRRDAAVELGLPDVPVEIRYFGHAERQGTVWERHQRGASRG